MIISQRLVQKICTQCKSSQTTIENDMAAKKLGYAGEYITGKGCRHCNDTGYQSRTAVFEILEIDDEVSRRIASGQSEADLRTFCNEKGYVDLKLAGIKLVRDQVTTPVEILKAVMA